MGRWVLAAWLVAAAAEPSIPEGAPTAQGRPRVVPLNRVARAKRSGCVNRPFANPPVTERILNHQLLVRRETRVAHAFNRTDASRYFQIVDVPRGRPPPFEARCGGRNEVLLLAKSGLYPNANKESYTTLYDGCDAGLRRCDDPSESCVRHGRVIHRDKKIDHNLGCLLAVDALVCVGGMLKQAADRTTVLAAAGRDALSKRGLVAAGVAGFGSAGSGCVELRPGNHGNCEFDGRFSLARLAAGPDAGQIFFYARANMSPSGGGRYVTGARVDPLRGDWSGAHRAIRFVRRAPGPSGGGAFRYSALDDAYGAILADLEAAADLADIYFPTVSANPSDGGRTLLGLFPTALSRPDLEGDVLVDKGGHPETAALLLAVSEDGIRFSPPVALVDVFPNRGEMNDHAVDGLVSHGKRVYFYAHAGVPGTLAHLCPKVMPRGDDRPESRLVQYAMRTGDLLRFTRDALRHLRAAPPDRPYVANASGIFVLP